MPKGSQSERLATVETEVGSLRQDITHIKTTVDALAKAQQAAQQAAQTTNWPFIISILTAAGMLLGGLFVASTLYALNMALQSKLEIMDFIQPVVISSEQSKVDRQALHTKVELNSEKVFEVSAKSDARYAEARSSLSEIEAQFKNVGTTANLRYAENQKLLSLLWQKVYGVPLPDIEYFPKAEREITP